MMMMTLFMIFSIVVWLIPFLNLLVFPKYVMSGITACFAYMCLLKQIPSIFTCLMLLTVGALLMGTMLHKFTGKLFNVKNVCLLNIILYIVSFLLVKG